MSQAMPNAPLPSPAMLAACQPLLATRLLQQTAAPPRLWRHAPLVPPAGRQSRPPAHPVGPQPASTPGLQGCSSRGLTKLVRLHRAGSYRWVLLPVLGRLATLRCSSIMSTQTYGSLLGLCLTLKAARFPPDQLDKAIRLCCGTAHSALGTASANLWGNSMHCNSIGS